MAQGVNRMRNDPGARGGAMLAGAVIAALAMLAASDARAMQNCRTNLTGTTFCADGTVIRATLNGVRIGPDRRVERRSLVGGVIDSTGRYARVAPPLPEADGQMWGPSAPGAFAKPATADPVGARIPGATGGVACATAAALHFSCF